MKTNKRFDLAETLLDLQLKVDSGMEFPDAFTDIVCSLNLNTNQAQRLQDAYDEDDSGPSYREDFHADC